MLSRGIARVLKLPPVVFDFGPIRQNWGTPKKGGKNRNLRAVGHAFVGLWTVPCTEHLCMDPIVIDPICALQPPYTKTTKAALTKMGMEIEA